ncbi:TonB-dependent receptor [Fulvivirga lutea]|uniref:TonB-dependent receptor n=1 Tax=Fulvivirga lutea TaxID=2810512 RepID=A0A975A010_9BACT|nr:hypothetical protein [Fulvivirga lutea]QSE96715.1 hypothetical protein JR347_14080 [Fulvivirga lutea]
MKITKYILVLSLIFGGMQFVSAQENWESDGEIEDVEIEIVKDREITLPKANRNFEKIAPINFSGVKPQLEYSFDNLNLPLPSLNIRVRPLRIKEQPLKKLYGNYIRAGFGNYITPYFEGFVSSKRSRDMLYGAHINFLNSRNGPVDDENSGSGEFDVEGYGKHFGKKLTVGGDIGYHRRSYNFYGYPENQEVNEDSLSQNFNNIHLSGYIENTDKSSDLNFYTGIQFDYLKDNFSAEESEVQLDFKGSYKLGGQSTINLRSDLDIISQKDEGLDVKTRNIFRVVPTLTFEYEGFLIDAGFNVVYENDTLGDSDEIHFFPMARARYSLSSGFEVQAGIRGDVNKQTLRGFVESNPFLAPNSRAFNQYNNFEFFGGIGGSLTSKLGFKAGMSISSLKNLPLFINSPEDQSKFLVIYDTGNSEILNINAQLSYNRNEILRLTLRGDYWGYDTDESEEAWHRPNYKISALSTFKLFDKLRFETEAYAIGGIQALDFNTGEKINLDAALDLNFMAEYLVSDQFSGWVRLNNIFGQEYEMLYNYPVRGFQVMIGATYSF